jgi:hypothetical protein
VRDAAKAVNGRSVLAMAAMVAKDTTWLRFCPMHESLHFARRKSICLEINIWQLSIATSTPWRRAGTLKTLGQTRSRAEAAPFDRERFASGLGARLLP